MDKVKKLGGSEIYYGCVLPDVLLYETIIDEHEGEIVAYFTIGTFN
jgi:hypothetical protein